MEKEKALQRYSSSQQSLKVLLAKIPEDRKTNTAVEGLWTLKELLCHFIGWDQSLLEPLKTLVYEGDFPVQVFQDHDSFNISQVSKRQDLSLKQVIDELGETSQNLLDLVASLDQDQCQATYATPWGGESTIPAMLAGLAWHIDDHLMHVKDAVNQFQDGIF